MYVPAGSGPTAMLPTALFDPLQLPVAVHDEGLFVADQLNVVLAAEPIVED